MLKGEDCGTKTANGAVDCLSGSINIVEKMISGREITFLLVCEILVDAECVGYIALCYKLK